MALRSLDNALPTTPERPKKQAKVSVPVSKQSEFPVNDENRAPLPPVAAESIEYILSEDLKPVADPDIKFQGLVEGLKSEDWLRVCESLNDVRRLSLFHSSLLLPILETVMLVLVKSMKNPRSALCKTSIMASSDIFKAYGDKLLESNSSDAVDQLVLQLLLKASQDKKFVCDEADRALNTMVESTSPLPLLHKLKGYVSHGNLRVRAKAAVSISQCVLKMGMEGLKEYGLVPMIQMAAELLKDRLPKAREAARTIVTLLHEAYVADLDEREEKQENWESFCQSNLLATDALAVVKVVPSK